MHHELALFVLADPEAERAVEDVRELLVLVLMPRYDAAFLQVDVRQHHARAGDQAPIQHRRDFLLRHLLPAVQRHVAH